MAESYVNVKCHRSGKSVYAADKPVNIDLPSGERWTFLRPNFTCAATGAQLTLKNYKVFDGEVYINTYEYKGGKQPEAKVSGVADVITDRVKAVPDSNMRTGDRMFNITGKQATKHAHSEDPGSAYGVSAAEVVRTTNVPDSNMNTSDRLLQTIGNAGARGFAQAETTTSAYGAGSVGVETVKNVVKRPDTVQNVNMMEKRHNGTTKYTGVE